MTVSTLFFGLLASLCAWSEAVIASGMLAVDHNINSTVDRGAVGPSWACSDASLLSKLTLDEMIVQVLCHDPQIRQAWAEAMAQTAQVGIAQSAYLPRLNASTSISQNDTRYAQQTDDSVEGRQRQLDNRLNLSWVLFDFGRRESALRSAKQLLIAANANHDSRLQEAFVQAAQLYYATLAAQDSERAAQQVTRLAAENLKDASAKYEAGAAALSDRLQAQTAYSQARLSEIRAQGVVRDAKGQIALRMGMSPQTPLVLTGTLARRPGTAFVKSVDELLQQAREQNPSLVAARAKLNAARAGVSESKAAGRPSLSFIASLSDIHTQSVDYYANGHAIGNSIGVQLSIPIFEGFERTHQVRSAQAKMRAGEAELTDVEQRVSLDLWTNYQSLQVETQALDNTAEWLEQSTLALQVIKGRYRSGVGSMIELLNASSAYATAEQQHITALNSWHLARLRLAASLGHLGFWAL